MLTTEKINALSGVLGHRFGHHHDLMEALTHRSFLHENASHDASDNERLEFLGDAVLNLLVAQEVFERYPKIDEGQLSKIRSFAVNEESLANIARRLHLSDFLFLGKGESRQIEQKDAVLADALEAVMGAIYLDGGLEGSKKAWSHWQHELGLDLLNQKNLEDFDAKSQLQEFCLKTWHELPSYETTEVRGVQGPHFRVTLVIRGMGLLSIESLSKKKGELWLAQTCLKNKLHLLLPRN